MKNLFLALVIIAIFISGCRSTPEGPVIFIPDNPGMPENSVEQKQEPSDFSDVIGKEWKLIEVRINNINTNFSRSALATQGYADAFTLEFNTELLSGAGAPNRYSAPYSLGQGSAISVEMVRATLMAPIFEQAVLREHDYFAYIQNAYGWNLTGNNLELTSKNVNGETVILIFN
jgi:heat shock protein HslJ